MPSAAVSCCVFPALYVDLQSFHVALAHDLVAQLGADFHAASVAEPASKLCLWSFQNIKSTLFYFFFSHQHSLLYQHIRIYHVEKILSLVMIINNDSHVMVILSCTI